MVLFPIYEKYNILLFSIHFKLIRCKSEHFIESARSMSLCVCFCHQPGSRFWKRQNFCLVKYNGSQRKRRRKKKTKKKKKEKYVCGNGCWQWWQVTGGRWQGKRNKWQATYILKIYPHTLKDSVYAIWAIFKYFLKHIVNECEEICSWSYNFSVHLLKQSSFLCTFFSVRDCCAKWQSCNKWQSRLTQMVQCFCRQFVSLTN